MRVSVEWLREFVHFPWTPAKLADRLTSVGLEVESVTPVSLGLEKVLVGKVATVKPHPEVSQWKVCTIFLGGETVSLVCGAPNARVGMTVATALPGTSLPSGIDVGEKVLRGVASKGMLCSEAELGLGPDGTGLLSLPETAKPGLSLEEILGGSDVAFEIKVTPNRPDCLSMIGIAREVAALLGRKIRVPKIALTEKGENVGTLAGLGVKSSRDCPRYIGRVIAEVVMGSSPLWMVRRLKAVGMRPISNAVDITNYVLWETGQPLHAFDLEQLEGRKVIVRRALAGEKITTLDGVERTLDPEILVIADARRPVALAGIMGGLTSEVTLKTKHILLESAWFSPGLIRSGAKRLGLRTEASYRFERGTDSEAVSYASQRAARMLVDLAGGTLAKGCLDRYPKPFKPLTIFLRQARVEAVLGESIPPSKVKQALTRMGIEVKVGAGSYRVRIPSFRPDLTREIDLIEEVARGYGYHRFKGAFGTRGSYVGSILPEEGFEKRLRSLLVGFGFVEILTPSLARKVTLEGASVSEDAVALKNPLSEEMAVLRPSLLSGMLEVIARNIGFGTRELRLFEIGKTFCVHAVGVPGERSILGVALTGRVRPAQFGDLLREVDLFDLKGVLDGVLSRMGLSNSEVIPSKAWSFLDLGGTLKSTNLEVGCLGRVKRSVAERFNIRNEVFFAELEIEPLYKSGSPRKTAASLSRFPVVERDISVIVSEETSWASLERTVREAGGDLLEEVNLFDIFRHKQLGQNRKAFGIALRFRASDRTLSTEEVEEIQAGCLKRLSEDFGAKLRT